jgi:hypothetical protein
MRAAVPGKMPVSGSVMTEVMPCTRVVGTWTELGLTAVRAFMWAVSSPISLKSRVSGSEPISASPRCVPLSMNPG